MSISFLAAGLAIREGAEPDWEAGIRAARSLAWPAALFSRGELLNTLASLNIESLVDEDPDDLRPWHAGRVRAAIGEVRDVAESDLLLIKSGLEEGHRELVLLEPPGWRVYLTGGASGGEIPDYMFEPIICASALGTAGGAGFTPILEYMPAADERELVDLSEPERRAVVAGTALADFEAGLPELSEWPPERLSVEAGQLLAGLASGEDPIPSLLDLGRLLVLLALADGEFDAAAVLARTVDAFDRTPDGELPDLDVKQLSYEVETARTRGECLPALLRVLRGLAVLLPDERVPAPPWIAEVRLPAVASRDPVISRGMRFEWLFLPNRPLDWQAAEEACRGDQRLVTDLGLVRNRILGTAMSGFGCDAKLGDRTLCVCQNDQERAGGCFAPIQRLRAAGVLEALRVDCRPAEEMRR